MASLLAAVHIGLADRARRAPACPAGRVFHSPLGDVEVEGADQEHVRLVVGPQGLALVDASVGQFDGGGLVAGAVLPGACRLRAQAQVVDARMVQFQVAPEVAGEDSSQVAHGGVVERGLAFFEVVNQEITHGRAGDAVAIDELVNGELAAGTAERTDGGRRVSRELAESMEHLVEQGSGVRLALHCPLHVDHLDAVPHRDVAQQAALVRHDDGHLVEGPPAERWPHRAIHDGLSHPGDPLRVAAALHRQREMGRAMLEDPAHAGPDHVGTDQASIPPAMSVRS